MFEFLAAVATIFGYTLGWIFLVGFIGFVVFIVTTTEAPPLPKQKDPYFDKIEEFRNDFK